MVRRLAACAFLLLLSPAPASAEWQFAPMVGLLFKGATNIVDIERATTKTHRQAGGAISLLGGGILGVEAIGTWAPGFFELGDLDQVEQGRTAALMGNIVLTAPRRWTEYSLRPFFSGGVGLMHATVKQSEDLPAGAPFDPVRLNASGYNLGAGAIGFFSERTGVRFDFRYYSTFRRSADLISIEPESSYLRYMTASIGIVWRR